MTAGPTYSPIATTTLGSDVASYTFTSIPQTYTDLVLVYSGLGTNGDLQFQFNGDTGGSNTNYSGTGLYGSGITAGSSRASNANAAYIAAVRTSTQVTATAHIMDYASSAVYKTVLSGNGSSDYEVHKRSSLWRNTAAITSILVKNTGGNLLTGSIITLYGIATA